MGSEEERLHELLRQVNEAVLAAERIREESEVVAHITAQLREDGLTSRCAWCGRYRAAERWVRLEHPPRLFAQSKLSHGICPDCVTNLRMRGKSV